MRILHFSLLAAALGVSACGGPLINTATGPCPKIGVLPDAADYPVRGPNGQILGLASLSVVHGACVYNTSRARETGYSSVQVLLTVFASGVRSPGADLDEITAPYVVATVADDGVLTGREEYVADINLGLDGKGSEEEKINVVMPYKGIVGDANQHRIVVAFKLDREDVELNRSRLGR